ncbi:Bifunctional uridylyltransferase/uridylyl-removing enzyme [invertebrate metagenome]|uniref:Bifunctional uridylyltransferase/uridylyl-removing enzyme n=1 Tax=invertebrate metagenome TaxID=1711999 RepID=A0A2H9TAD9_9ZZZZ
MTELASPIKQQLFDKGQFRADLTLHPSPIAAFKKWLKTGNQQLNRWFYEDMPVDTLVHARSWLIDQLLCMAWKNLTWPEQNSPALLATGGYGRRELHPGSDIDILILCKTDNDYARYHDSIEHFLALLWDIGLKPGSSVRSLDESYQQAKNNLSIITNLMESRLLCGPEPLFTALKKHISPDHIWSEADYFKAKLQEQKKRHLKYDNSAYALEPNIKGSPGGLRDLHMLGWIAARYYGTYDLTTLVDHQFLTSSESESLIQCRTFLWKIRWALHTISGRCEDRLLFDYQKELSQQFGYKDTSCKLAVEQFMQTYFRTVMTLAKIKDVLLQHFDTLIMSTSTPEYCIPINSLFHLHNHYIEVNHPEVFEQYPPALLEAFVLTTKIPGTHGLSAATIRLITDNLYRINEEFRHDPRCNRLFVELLQASTGLTRALRRMARYGVLGQYLPEFGKITGQMQFDLFHVHTVDAHTLLLIQYLRRFFNGTHKECYPLACRIMKKLTAPRLLYIAALYHDIGKGRGGDHSRLGALDAIAFCRLHGFSGNDTELVTWLVKHHLLLSVTAQRQDLSDPEIIRTFAHKVGTRERLNYLYALTVADINATNPNLWTGWRASLLQQLYYETQRFFRQGSNKRDHESGRILHIQRKVIRLLRRQNITQAQAIRLWHQFDPHYFLCHSADDIVWHTHELLIHPQQDNSASSLITVRETSYKKEHAGSHLFIYTKDQPFLFALLVCAMDHLNLVIQDARILTTRNHYCLDTFTVLECDGSAIGNNPERIHTIKKHIHATLSQNISLPKLMHRRTPGYLRHFARTPEILINNRLDRKATQLEIIATDRPGLLAIIGKAFVALNLRVHSAKVATFGEKAEDSFSVTDDKNQPITDAKICRLIRDKLDEVLNPTESYPEAYRNSYNISFLPT